MRIATASAVFAALAVAGCSASQSSSTPASAPAATSRSAAAAVGTGSTEPTASSSAEPVTSSASTAAATAASNPTAAATGTAKPTTVDGNITIAAAGDLQSGPMKITPLYCGKLTAAQQARFGTTAVGGLIYRYANHASASGAAKLYVGFTNGTTVAGENYAGQVSDITDGQSAEGEVDAIGISGQDLTFTGCEVMSYALYTTATGLDPVSYAG